MKGVRIGVWMTGMNLALVLLVAAGLVPGGLLLLRRLSRESASARVQLAAAGAVEGLRRHAGEVLTSARLLAERPTLQRLVEEESHEKLAAFLSTFRETGRLHGCAAFRHAELVAASPADLPWATIRERSAEGLHYLLLPGSAGGSPGVVARVPLAGELEGEALAFRRLDAALARELEGQVGLPVLFVSGVRQSVSFREGEGWRAWRRIDERAPGDLGVEVGLPESLAAAALRPLERSFVVVTCAAVLAAVIAGALATRQLSRPLTQLQMSATAIGAGDLTTPVPRASGVEAGALAETMEGMRQHLQRATTELHQRELEARLLLEGMVEGVFAVGPDRRIQYLNPQAARRLGTSVEAAVGKFCGDVLRPSPHEGRRPCDDACPIVHARSRGSSRAVEHLQLAAGVRTVVITSAPPAGARQVQLMRDETDVEAARRSRDAVLANVSHELKTPLSAQMASIQLLQDALGDEVPAAAVELVGSLERSTLRLARLIDNLLESVRIETGYVLLRKVAVDLTRVIGEAEAMMLPLLRQRGQEVSVELPAELPAVLGDPVQLVQVFVNLLANAHKFSPDGSTIRIGGAPDGASVSVRVEDAGPGIPPSERRAVFDHFYRLEAHVAEGMGLGLWIVRSIVERHGGSVEAGASAEGGARVVVTLPAAGA